MASNIFTLLYRIIASYLRVIGIQLSLITLFRAAKSASMLAVSSHASRKIWHMIWICSRRNSLSSRIECTNFYTYLPNCANLFLNCYFEAITMWCYFSNKFVLVLVRCVAVTYNKHHRTQLGTYSISASSLDAGSHPELWAFIVHVRSANGRYANCQGQPTSGHLQSGTTPSISGTVFGTQYGREN